MDRTKLMFIPDVFDINAIVQLHNSHRFPMPDLTNPLYISKRMCITNGQLTAAGFVKIMAEGILMVDERLPVMTRVKSAVAIIDQLKKDAKNAGLDSCHVFVSDKKVHNFLQHYGFEDCPEKYTMYIEF